MELIAEFIIEIVGELFTETAAGMSESSYIPKWIRILIVTIIAGLLFLIVCGICEDNTTARAIFGGLVVLAWIFMVVRVARIKTKKYESVVVEGNIGYCGKRGFFGWVSGPLDLSNLGHWVTGDGRVKMTFCKDHDLPRKERIVKIGDKETQFLKTLCKKTEGEFNYYGNQARIELQKKIKRFYDTNNGTGLKLTEIRFNECARKIKISYTFKDSISEKSVCVSEEKDLHVSYT